MSEGTLKTKLREMLDYVQGESELGNVQEGAFNHVAKLIMEATKSTDVVADERRREQRKMTGAAVIGSFVADHLKKTAWNSEDAVMEEDGTKYHVTIDKEGLMEMRLASSGDYHARALRKVFNANTSIWRHYDGDRHEEFLVRKIMPDGITQIFEGDRNNERMVRCEWPSDHETHPSRVEVLEGQPGEERLHHATWNDGTIGYYEGPPRNERIVRMERADGTTTYHEGGRNQEYVVRSMRRGMKHETAIYTGGRGEERMIAAIHYLDEVGVVAIFGGPRKQEKLVCVTRNKPDDNFGTTEVDISNPTLAPCMGNFAHLVVDVHNPPKRRRFDDPETAPSLESASKRAKEMGVRVELF